MLKTLIFTGFISRPLPVAGVPRYSNFPIGFGLDEHHPERSDEDASHCYRGMWVHRVAPGRSAAGRRGRGDRRRQFRPVLRPGRQAVQPGRGPLQSSLPAGRAGHPRRRGDASTGRSGPPRRDRPPGGPRGVRPSIEDPGLYADVNVPGTVHWLQAACRDRAPAAVRLRLELERLRRPARRPVSRDRPGRPADQPLCRDQEGLRAARLHLPPPARPAGHRACGSSPRTGRGIAPTWPSPSSPG